MGPRPRSVSLEQHCRQIVPQLKYLRISHWARVTDVACSAPSHYLNQCCNIVNLTLRNKIQWNLNRNSYFFINENAFENVVWKIAAILYLPQHMNHDRCGAGWDVEPSIICHWQSVYAVGRVCAPHIPELVRWQYSEYQQALLTLLTDIRISWRAPLLRSWSSYSPGGPFLVKVGEGVRNLT